MYIEDYKQKEYRLRTREEQRLIRRQDWLGSIGATMLFVVLLALLNYIAK